MAAGFIAALPKLREVGAAWSDAVGRTNLCKGGTLGRDVGSADNNGNDRLLGVIGVKLQRPVQRLGALRAHRDGDRMGLALPVGIEGDLHLLIRTADPKDAEGTIGLQRQALFGSLAY